jgi:DNA-binding CsgD family transcriptional regulator
MLDPSIDGSRDGLTAAAEQYGQLGYRFERARSLLFLGRLLAASGQRRESRATLEHAVAAFDDIGAGGWAERAKQELVGQGSTTSFGTSLSPSERRVAELVAAGRRNSEVAAELYVSVKTVEAHLSRIYGKLGVRSRTELARRLREVPRGSGSIAST